MKLGSSGIAESIAITVASLGRGTASFCSAARPSDLGRRKGSNLTMLSEAFWTELPENFKLTFLFFFHGFEPKSECENEVEIAKVFAALCEWEVCGCSVIWLVMCLPC